jgi:hypothetical protein
VKWFAIGGVIFCRVLIRQLLLERVNEYLENGASPDLFCRLFTFAFNMKYWHIWKGNLENYGVLGLLWFPVAQNWLPW